METATKTKKETEFRSEQFTFTIPRYMDELGFFHDSESFTFTIPRNKKGLTEELRILKKEDSINMSAYILYALEKVMGIGYKQGLIEELRRLKKENSINMSAYIVDALEKRIGHFSYISGLC